MRIVEQKNFNKKITENFDYDFDINERGLYGISVSASCRSGKQINERGGEDLRLEIDGQNFREILPEKNIQLYNIPASWNGTKLKGLKKSIIFILWLEKGKHKITFVPHKGAKIEDIDIEFVENTSKIEFNFDEKAEDGDRRPWYTFVLINLPLKSLSAKVTTKWRFLDSDDVKLIIDGKIQKPEGFFSKWKNWLWAGSIFKKLFQNETQTKIIELNLSQGIHYIEFHADRMPTLHNVGLDFGENVSKIQTYIYQGISGDEDYNKFDYEINKIVEYWNNIFINEPYPPEELLDPSLVKAMIYKESRMGYYDKYSFPDIMQVGHEDDPAMRTLRGELIESEIRKGRKPEKLNYKEAVVNNFEDSIHWGVRWLYHKAQGITNDERRYWRSWKDAVVGYGPDEQKYIDDIYRIYENGIDQNGNILWKNFSSGFSALKLFLVMGLILVLLLGVSLHLNSKDLKNYSEEKNLTAEIKNSVDLVFFQDLEDYKKGNKGEFSDNFENTIDKCEELNCMDGVIFRRYYEYLVEFMKDNNQFIYATSALGILPEKSFKRDIDGDGENEIVFAKEDFLNRENIFVTVVDKIDDKFKMMEFKVNGGHRGYVDLVDVTGDLKPEILLFFSFGRGGYHLLVYQYSKEGDFSEIFKHTDLLYSNFVISDFDNDDKMEIIVEGDFKGIEGVVQKKEIFEYSKKINGFVKTDY